MPGLKIYNQEVTNPEAVTVLNKLKIDPRFRAEFEDGNLSPDEVKKIALPPNGAKNLDLKNAKLVGLEDKEYVTFIVEAHSKAAIAPEDYIEFMKVVAKAAPNTLAPAEAPKPTETGTNPDQKPVISTKLYQKGIEQLVGSFGFDIKKFPIGIANDVEAQLIDQAKRKVPPYIIGEFPLRKNLYYPVVIEERAANKVTAIIPNIKNQSELSEFAKDFPKLEDLEKRLGAGHRILNSGFVSRGDFYIYASNGNPPQGKVFLYSKDKLTEMPVVHHVTPAGGSKQVEVFLTNGRAYNFPDVAKPNSNGMHLLTTRLVPLPYQ